MHAVCKSNEKWINPRYISYVHIYFNFTANFSWVWLESYSQIISKTKSETWFYSQGTKPSDWLNPNYLALNRFLFLIV